MLVVCCKYWLWVWQNKSMCVHILQTESSSWQCPLVERSLMPSRKTTCSLHLAKKMEGGGGGEGSKARRGVGIRGGGSGDHKDEKKCDFSCHQKDAMYFASIWSLSGTLFLQMVSALWNDLAPWHFLFMFLPNQDAQSEQGRGVGCIRKLVPVDTVVQFYAHILVTGSQCNDHRTAMMCSQDFVLITIAKPGHFERYHNAICCILSQKGQEFSQWPKVAGTGLKSLVSVEMTESIIPTIITT